MPLSAGVAPVEKRAVPDRGDRGKVIQMGVGEHRALGQQAVQAAVVFVAEASQVIVAKLIDDNRQDQFGFLRSRCRQDGCEQKTSEKLLHRWNSQRSIGTVNLVHTLGYPRGGQ